MGVDGAKAVKRALGSALAERLILAGLCCFDAGYHRHARNHYRQAVELATKVGDHHRAARALQFAGQQRPRLVSLAEALAARPGSDAQDLARTARQLAATRA
ncbi:MAG: hypothetical protein ACT4NY_15275 [Pseudonocardiales bacterium]